MDLTPLQFICIAVLIMFVVSAIGLCIVAIMFAADDEEDEASQGPMVKRWPADYTTGDL